jgi:hypothetical protein
LAGKAIENDILEMDKSELQSAIRQPLQLQQTNEFKESAYYKRFEELRITDCSGKFLELFGKSRAVYIPQSKCNRTNNFIHSLINNKIEGRAHMEMSRV